MANPPALILLSGLPGAGKTTFALALARVLDFEHLESDAVRARLFRVPRHSPWESARVFAEVERLAASALAAGRTALIDATNLTPRDRRRFYQLATHSGRPLLAIRLTAPIDELARRLAEPRVGASTAGIDVMRLMLPRVHPFPARSLIIDTRYPLDPSLRLLARILKESSA